MFDVAGDTLRVMKMWVAALCRDRKCHVAGERVDDIAAFFHRDVRPRAPQRTMLRDARRAATGAIRGLVYALPHAVTLLRDTAAICYARRARYSALMRAALRCAAICAYSSALRAAATRLRAPPWCGMLASLSRRRWCLLRHVIFTRWALRRALWCCRRVRVVTGTGMREKNVTGKRVT